MVMMILGGSLEVGLVRRRHRRHLVGSTAAILRHDPPQLVLHARKDDRADAVGQRLIVVDEREEAIGVEAEEGYPGWSGPDLGGRGRGGGSGGRIVGLGGIGVGSSGRR